MSIKNILPRTYQDYFKIDPNPKHFLLTVRNIPYFMSNIMYLEANGFQDLLVLIRIFRYFRPHLLLF